MARRARLLAGAATLEHVDTFLAMGALMGGAGYQLRRLQVPAIVLAHMAARVVAVTALPAGIISLHVIPVATHRQALRACPRSFDPAGKAVTATTFVPTSMWAKNAIQLNDIASQRDA